MWNCFFPRADQWIATRPGARGSAGWINCNASNWPVDYDYFQILSVFLPAVHSSSLCIRALPSSRHFRWREQPPGSGVKLAISSDHSCMSYAVVHFHLHLQSRFCKYHEFSLPGISLHLQRYGCIQQKNSINLGLLKDISETLYNDMLGGYVLAGGRWQPPGLLTNIWLNLTELWTNNLKLIRTTMSQNWV